MSSTLVATPLTSSCAEVAMSATHVCLGISPFNGYYNQERITQLVGWGLGAAEKVHFYVPDMSPRHTFEALGYAPNKARTKARRQGIYVLNKIRTALAEHGVADPEPFLLWSQTLESNDTYTALRSKGKELFESDPEFRQATLETSRWVLAGKMPDDAEPTPEQQVMAVEYFLDELPLFLDTPAIVGCGASMFVYHQPVAYLERLFKRELALQPVDGQGFWVLAD